MAHWLTNRGKLLLAQGAWDDGAAGLFKVRLLSNGTGVVPIAMDTEAEIQDLATVSALLGLSGVTEVAVAGYTAGGIALTRSNFTQDDTNNRAAADAANVVFSGLATGTSIYGGFICEISTDTSDATRQLVSVFTLATAIPTNGSDVTLTIADLYYLT